MPKYTVRRIARKYGPYNPARSGNRGYRKYAAATLIQRRWRKTGLTRPTKYQRRRFNNMGDKAQRYKISTANNATTTDTLTTISLLDPLTFGNDPGNRHRRYADIIGVSVNLIVQNEATLSPIMFHSAILQSKWTSAATASASDNFFTAPGGTAEGYAGISFSAAGLPRTLKNQLSIYKGHYNVFKHKKNVINGDGAVNERPAGTAGSSSTAYIKFYAPINQRIYFDSNVPSKKLDLMLWAEPLNINDDAGNFALKYHNTTKVYFKNT